MGCVRFILAAIAMAIFIRIEWITPISDVNFWVALLILLFLVWIIDGILWLLQAFVKILAIPAAILTGTLAWTVIGGIFKYFSLYLAASITGFFALPWIFGEQWLHALIIGFVFMMIGMDLPKKSKSK